jgi:death-on-curing protein
MQSAFGEDAYPTLFLKAAAIVQSLAENQSFVDGNKRIAWLAGTAFLHVNGLNINASAEEGNRLFRERIARGMTVEELADWLKHHSSEIT